MTHRLSIALVALGVAGLTLFSVAGLGQPWPWVAVAVAGCLLEPVVTLCRAFSMGRDEQRLARELADRASVELNRHTIRLDGSLTREESVEIRGGWNAMVLRMSELEDKVELVTRELRTREAAVPFEES